MVVLDPAQSEATDTHFSEHQRVAETQKAYLVAEARR